MALLDEPRADENKDVRSLRRIFLEAFADEKEHLRDVVTAKERAWSIDENAPHTPPALNIDQLPTMVNLKAVTPIPLCSIVDGLPIDQQSTKILPTIQNVEETKSLGLRFSDIENYASPMRKFVKSSGIYALGSMASPLIALILAPFLTHHLSHSEYGALAVLNTAIALVAGITQLGLVPAFFRLYNYDYESQSDRHNVLSTTIILMSCISLTASVTIVVTAPWLAEFLLDSSSFAGAVRLAGCVILLQNLTLPGFSWLRAENRAIFSSTLTIASLLVALGATLGLVGMLHMGIIGSLLAVGGGYTVVVVCLLPVILYRAGLHLRIDVARSLLSFGIPIVGSFVSVWVLQLSDRYLLSRFGSLAETASYAVAYTLGSVLSPLLLGPFYLAWPSMMYAAAKKDDASQIFQLMFRWFSLLLLFAAFALSLVSIGVLDLLFPPAYHSAAPVIPIIAMSTMFYGIYEVFTAGVYIRRKIWLVTVFTAFAALINVILNIVLIPHYGSMGAALATLLAYAMLALIAYVVNQRIYPVPFEIGMFIIALLIGIVLYMGSSALAQKQPVLTAWGISFGALGLYTGCLVLLGILATRSHRYRRTQMKSVSQENLIV